jgi:tetratricopeptide (TPR) repeat protein
MTTVSLLIAPCGAGRTALLGRLVDGDVIGCDRRTYGVWSGVSSLLASWVDRIEPVAPELVERYAYELETVLPERRRSGRGAERKSLAETAANDERIRVFPADRTARIVQGLVDFLLQAVEVVAEGRLAIGCDAWDEAGHLVQSFLQELTRRCTRLPLKLILAVSPGRGAAATLAEWPGPPFQEVHQPLPPPPADPELTAAEAAREADLLSEALAADPSRAETGVRRLIDRLERSGDLRRALQVQAGALKLYNHQGFYEDAYELVAPVARGLDDLCQGDETARLNLLVQLYSNLVATGRAEQALPILEREGLPKIGNPKVRARIHYMLAMMHLRFLSRRDPDLAERHLLASIEEAERSDAPEDDKQFNIAFSMNGLALVHARQGRPAEAIALCRECLERIDAHFSRSRHVLFRSVLIYNIAQVYAGMNRLSEAIAHYSEVIELDPNYSEYYNERASLLLKVNRFAEAAADYRRAISLSPPYAEVWTNLGQCHRLLGEAEEALACYTRALDLSPGQFLARVGRAQILCVLGRREEAMADYSAALILDPKLPLLWANRAVLRHETGRCAEALADLDEAIRLAPEIPDLYRNRAVALKALGRLDEAERDDETSRFLAAVKTRSPQEQPAVQ